MRNKPAMRGNPLQDLQRNGGAATRGNISLWRGHGSRARLRRFRYARFLAATENAPIRAGAVSEIRMMPPTPSAVNAVK
jgi:hypothetical protein